MAPAEHIDFDAELPGADREPGCTFTFDGRTWTCKNRDDLPWELLQALVSIRAQAVADAEGAAVAAVLQVGPFFRQVLVPPDIPDWEAMMHRPDSPLTLATAKVLMERISEVVLLRPTGRPGDSPPGPSDTAGTSPDGSSLPGTAPEPLLA